MWHAPARTAHPGTASGGSLGAPSAAALATRRRTPTRSAAPAADACAWAAPCPPTAAESAPPPPRQVGARVKLSSTRRRRPYLAAPLQLPDPWRCWSLLKAVINPPPPSLDSAGGDLKGGGTRDDLLRLRRVHLRERLQLLRRSRPQPRWPVHLLRPRCRSSAVYI
ncbi:hypothetical protein PVAP13_9KG107513 [Panicum virgatum]|uniref:Uncharacterized protein n=1 Tax=Panicum virgatum TaxID=38727 RepID=A0A8T0NLG3_PANVG|nr:hypothetical protein PVAP13_9KG107513 [Panicum virgatum]